MITIIAIIIFIIFASGLLAQLMLRYFYGYRINNAGIEFFLFKRIRIKNIPFSNIEEVRRVAFKETLFLLSVLRFGNRIYGDMVLIRFKKGIIKKILITPDNADIFVRDFFTAKSR